MLAGFLFVSLESNAVFPKDSQCSENVPRKPTLCVVYEWNLNRRYKPHPFHLRMVTGFLDFVVVMLCPSCTVIKM